MSADATDQNYNSSRSPDAIGTTKAWVNLEEEAVKWLVHLSEKGQVKDKPVEGAAESDGFKQKGGGGGYGSAGQY